MYDIYVPVEQYEAEIAKVKHSISAMDNDRTSYNTSGMAKRSRDRERLLNTAAKLQFEMDRQLDHHKNVMSRLQREKEHWFQGCKLFYCLCL